MSHFNVFPFVSFADGNKDPHYEPLDLCFGGRRKFVGGSYVDFGKEFFSCFSTPQLFGSHSFEVSPNLKNYQAVLLGIFARGYFF